VTERVWLKWAVNLVWLALFSELGCTARISEDLTLPSDGSLGANMVWAKSGGWSATKTLTIGNFTKTGSMQVEFPEADTYTIQFGLGNPPVDASGNPVQTEALILWSVEGNFTSRRVSVANGVSISGVGQAVRVVVLDRTVQYGSNAAPVAADYDVSILVSKGTRPAVEEPATLVAYPPAGSTLALFVTAGATSVPVPIPQDAGAISVYITAISGTATLIPPEVIDANQVIGTLITKSYDPREFDDWVPLSPGAQQIVLDNTGSDTVYWSVTFGIDG